jgi:hypothetical protein
MSQSREVTSCDQGKFCKNSVENKGEGAAKCMLCRLAPGNENLDQQYWKPIDTYTNFPHPVLRKEKVDAVIERARGKRQQRRDRDQGKRKVARIAAAAEKQTEANFIKATKNSGRSNRDGDHVAVGFITIDTKHQDREHPLVSLVELEKVRRDARNAGNTYGALVLRNVKGYGVVAMEESDFAKMVGGWNALKDRQPISGRY